MPNGETWTQKLDTHSVKLQMPECVT